MGEQGKALKSTTHTSAKHKGMLAVPLPHVFKQLYLTPIENGWFRWPTDWESAIESTPYAIWICYPKPARAAKGIDAERRKGEDGNEHWWVNAARIKTGMFLEFVDIYSPKSRRSWSGGRLGDANFMYYQVAQRTSYAITLKRVPKSRVPKATGLAPRQKLRV